MMTAALLGIPSPSWVAPGSLGWQPKGAARGTCLPIGLWLSLCWPMGRDSGEAGTTRPHEYRAAEAGPSPPTSTLTEVCGSDSTPEGKDN